MNKPHVYMVTKTQVGNEDVGDYLRSAISKQFEGTDYSIVTERVTDNITHYSKGQIRKIKSYLIEVGNTTHNLFFDITDATTVR